MVRFLGLTDNSEIRIVPFSQPFKEETMEPNKNLLRQLLTQIVDYLGSIDESCGGIQDVTEAITETNERLDAIETQLKKVQRDLEIIAVSRD